jgi:hypothetical protein
MKKATDILLALSDYNIFKMFGVFCVFYIILFALSWSYGLILGYSLPVVDFIFMLLVSSLFFFSAYKLGVVKIERSLK